MHATDEMITENNRFHTITLCKQFQLYKELYAIL